MLIGWCDRTFSSTAPAQTPWPIYGRPNGPLDYRPRKLFWGRMPHSSFEKGSTGLFQLQQHHTRRQKTAWRAKSFAQHFQRKGQGRMETSAMQRVQGLYQPTKAGQPIISRRGARCMPGAMSVAEKMEIDISHVPTTLTVPCHWHKRSVISGYLQRCGSRWSVQAMTIN